MAENDQIEKFEFKTEVNQLLKLVIHSLYSNQEIFVRELISNASDALDKLRYKALEDNSLYGDDAEPKIQVTFTEDTITIADNGIGMSRDDAIEHLGTIAKSGTKEFLQSLTGNASKDSQLIGQFGVGFYSAYIVADKVTVRTRKAGTKPEEAVSWVSDGEGGFEIENITKEGRGTEVILHLKKDCKEFADAFRLRSIVNKYSDHLSFPIFMIKQEMPTQAKEGEEEKKEDENKEPEFEQVNKATALWTRPRKDVKVEEYKEFYKSLGDWEDPLIWSHNKVEGKHEYTSLLYIPNHPPFDLFQREGARGLKLYVQRIFIMDDADQFLPMYLRFVKGVIDSNDLPLNVSREILQSNRVVESIKSALTKRVLNMLDKLSKDDAGRYAKFWEAFGNVIKEGVIEDHANKEAIGQLMRFSTTDTDTEKQETSFDDYISRMKDGQDKIYYVVAENFDAAKNSPHLEIFRKNGIEVLLLHDRIDDWLVGHLNEYKGKQLESVSKDDLDLGKLEKEENKTDTKAQEKEYGSLLKQIKKILDAKVEEVRLTQRLTDSPARLVMKGDNMSLHLAKMMEATGQKMPEQKFILELNGEHQLIERLNQESDDDKVAEWSKILFDQALLAEGGQLDDPATFVKRLNKMFVAQ